jgi:two-component sensor histidine kinase
MGEAIRTFDWAQTSIGSFDRWPLALRTAVGLILNTKFPMCIVWGKSLLTIYNDAFEPILGGKTDALGRSFQDIWSEAWEAIGSIAEKALSGESTFIENFELEIDRNGAPETAYFTFSYSPIRDTDGDVVGFLDTVVETTPTVQSVKATRLLNEELGHRLKNTLALVQAMASQTLSRAEDRAAVETFNKRLAALSRAHDVLTKENWAHARMSVVVEEAVRLHDRDRFDIGGRELVLGPKAALSLSLLLHELGTNAVKHGALSAPQGRVSIAWTIECDELEFRWTEAGGLPAVQPANEGLGSRLIKAGLSGAGGAELDYASHGFSARFRAPLKHLTDN